MTWCLFRGVGLANAHCYPPTRPLISAKNLISHLISSFFTGLLKTLYTTTRYYYNKDVQKWWWNPIGRRKRGHYNCPKYFEKQQKIISNSIYLLSPFLLIFQEKWCKPFCLHTQVPICYETPLSKSNTFYSTFFAHRVPCYFYFIL